MAPKLLSLDDQVFELAQKGFARGIAPTNRHVV